MHAEQAAEIAAVVKRRRDNEHGRVLQLQARGICQDMGRATVKAKDGRLARCAKCRLGFAGGLQQMAPVP
jgi:hypothetical protein